VTTPRTPITPAAFEAEMHDLDDRLESLRLQLVDARNCENDAKRDFEIAKVTAAMHPSCPRVRRGEVTVAERQAWIDEHILDKTLALQDAKHLRVIASEALRTAQKQVEVNQSIGASLRTSQSSYGNQSYGRRP
jgi:hypothetical protein